MILSGTDRHHQGRPARAHSPARRSARPMLSPMRRLVPTLAVLLLLTGCTSPQPEAPEPTPTSTPTPSEAARAEVDWERYPTNYRQIIDEETAENDCTALQDMFDAAPDDPDLLTYIDQALEQAGCY